MGTMKITVMKRIHINHIIKRSAARGEDEDR